MIAENAQRLREALLLLDFSPEELADLSQDELRILAAIPYLPPPVSAGGRVGDPLRPRHRQMLAALLSDHRRPRIARPAVVSRRRTAIGPRGVRRRRSSGGTGPPDDPEPI